MPPESTKSHFQYYTLAFTKDDLEELKGALLLYNAHIAQFGSASALVSVLVERVKVAIKHMEKQQ